MGRPRIRFDPPRQGRRVPLTVIMALAVAASIVFVNLRGDEAVAATTAAAPRPPAPPPRGTAAVAGVDPAAPRGVAPAASSAVPPQEPADDPCLGQLRPRAGENREAMQQRVAQDAEPAALRLFTGLQARSDDLSRAAMHLLQIENPQSLQDLARVASQSTDRRVYPLALHTCRGSREGNCQLITPQGWAERDPTNAIAWLTVMAAARERGDAVGVEAALHRAADATTADFGYGAAFAPVLALRREDPARDEPIPLLVGTSALMHLLGLEAAWSATHSQAFINHCRGELLPDRKRAPLAASRVPACRRIAELLALHARSSLDRYLGETVLQDHWPPERIERLRAERHVLTAFTVEQGLDPLSSRCTRLQSSFSHFEAVGRLGEVGAAIEAIDASDRPMAERIEHRLRTAASSAIR